MPTPQKSYTEHARWQAMLSHAQMLLCAAAEEMQTTMKARSKAWQESAHTEKVLAKLERRQETISQLEACA